MTLREALDAMTSHPRPFSTGELLSIASRHGLENALRRGEVTRVLPGLYAASLHAESWLVRARAALEWAPEAALSGASALFACGAVIDPPARVEVVVPRNGSRRYPAWIAARRTDLPLPTVLWDPDLSGTDEWRSEQRSTTYRILAPATAVAVGYGAQPAGLRAELVYGPVRSGCATPEEIAAAVGLLPKVRGRRGLLRRLALASDGMESYLEEVGARDVLAGQEFAGLVRQHRLRAGSAVYRADAYHAPSMTDFEFDGARFHDPRRLEDSRRDALLASEGVLTVRFGHADVMNRPRWCRDLALRTLRSRVRDDPLRRR